MYTLSDSVQPFWGKKDQGNIYRLVPDSSEFSVAYLEMAEAWSTKKMCAKISQL